MDTDALHGGKRPAQGAKAKAGRAPGEPLQRSDGRFPQQPEGNGRPGAPLFVALLAKTASLGFVGCRDWRAMPPVRVCVHSVKTGPNQLLCRIRALRRCSQPTTIISSSEIVISIVAAAAMVRLMLSLMPANICRGSVR